MATLNLPTWFDVYECEATLVPEVRGFAGPFGGPTEMQDLLGDRWRLRLTLPDGDFNHGGRTEALFNRLRGGANWLRLYHLAKPVPRGTARGIMTLAASVAQGASTMVIDGVVGLNAVLGGSFEFDSNTDGLADGWTRYSNGSTGTLLASISTTAVASGTYSQSLVATALGAGGGDRNGVQQTASVVHLAGQTVTLAGSLAGTSGTTLTLYAAWRDISNNPVGTDVFAVATATGAAQLLSATGTCPANAVTAIIYAHQSAGSGGSATLLADAVRLVAGSSAGVYPAPGVLSAGDMIGHNSEQLFQVFEDATALDQGQVNVTITGRVRKAIASGQTIVWDKPNVPFQLLDTAGVPTAYTRGRARGQQVEFIEAWQA